MTVKQLRDALAKFPDDFPVFFEDSMGGGRECGLCRVFDWDQRMYSAVIETIEGDRAPGYGGWPKR
jgi:hypothetical protein